MKKYLKLLTILFLSLFILLSALNISYAKNDSIKLASFKDSFKNNLINAGVKASFITQGEANSQTGQASEEFANTLIANIILYAISLVGIIFLVLIIYSGIQWMTASGNEEKISKAKKRIINGIVGLGLTLLAFIISTVIYNYLDKQFLGDGVIDNNAPEYRLPCKNYYKAQCETAPARELNNITHCVWVDGDPLFDLGGYCI